MMSLPSELFENRRASFGKRDRILRFAHQSRRSFLASGQRVAPAVGYFGSISRAKYDSLMATVAASSSSAASSASSAASSASSVTATGTGLTITSATQPAATLAVKSAARLPTPKCFDSRIARCGCYRNHGGENRFG